MNGLTFSTPDAYDWSKRTASVYGSVTRSPVCCTLVDAVENVRGTWVV